MEQAQTARAGGAQVTLQNPCSPCKQRLLHATSCMAVMLPMLPMVMWLSVFQVSVYTVDWTTLTSFCRAAGFSTVAWTAAAMLTHAMQTTPPAAAATLDLNANLTPTTVNTSTLPLASSPFHLSRTTSSEASPLGSLVAPALSAVAEQEQSQSATSLGSQISSDGLLLGEISARLPPIPTEFPPLRDVQLPKYEKVSGFGKRE